MENKPSKEHSVSQEVINDIYESFLTTICVEIASDMHRFAKTGVLPYSQLVVSKRKHHLEYAKNPNQSKAVTEPQEHPETAEGVKELEEENADTNNGYKDGVLVGAQMQTASIDEPRASSPSNMLIIEESTIKRRNMLQNSNAAIEKEEVALSISSAAFGISPVEDNDGAKDSKLDVSGNMNETATIDHDMNNYSVTVNVHNADESRRDEETSSATMTCNDASAASFEKQEIASSRSNHSALDIYGRIPPKEPKITSTICLLCGRSVSAMRFAPHLDKCK